MQQLCDKGTPMTTDSLATATNTGSRSTCLRVMRVLVAHRIVTEAGTECFCANNRSRFLILPAVQSGIRHLYPLSAEATLHIPSWMASNRYREPVSVAEGPFASRFGKTFWDVLREEPERHVAFSASMESVYEEHVIDKDADIVWEAIADGMDAAQPHHGAMLVDIGGAKGHLVRTIQKRHKPVGRLVLQDRASTVASIAADALPGVTVSAYDFFAPQPERGMWSDGDAFACIEHESLIPHVFNTGARAYCLRHILHDWPDERCREILRNVVDAMTHGYSKLLVLDMMLPDTGCGAESAMSDLMLLAVFCGKERSRRQFQELFASVGLVMQKATMSGQGTAEAVIECVLEKAET